MRAASRARVNAEEKEREEGGFLDLVGTRPGRKQRAGGDDRSSPRRRRSRRGSGGDGRGGDVRGERELFALRYRHPQTLARTRLAEP